MKQKNIFLSGEGDKWYKRNEEALLNKDFSQDLVVKKVIDLIDSNHVDPDLKLIEGMVRLLEIGCGEGRRLAYLQKKYNI